MGKESTERDGSIKRNDIPTLDHYTLTFENPLVEGGT